MLFNSVQFLVFLPVVLLVYFIIPDKVKYIWLLICSYYFYMCWDAKYIVLLLFSTLITYCCGRLIESSENLNTRKCYMALSVFLNMMVLFFFKYFDFAFENINRVANIMHIQLNAPQFDIVLPVGISFYIFQALGYTIDVYRKELLPICTFCIFLSTISRRTDRKK